MSWRTTLGLALTAALVAAGTGAQTEVLFSETFTGPNRSQPAGWQNVNTPEGNQWYLRSGEFTSGNGDNIIQQDKRTWAVAEAGLGEGWSDYEVVVDAHMNQRIGGFMLVARWDESGNHYSAVYETRNGVIECRIERIFDDRTEVLARTTSEQNANLPNLANGQTRADGRTFRFVLQADLLTFFIDRREILTARDATIRQGTAGLGQFENFVFFDNFRVIGASPAQAVAAASQSIGEVYRLQIAENLPRQEARSYQRYLEDNGFFPVILNENAAGQYEVLTGAFLSRDEAERRGDFLASEGEIFAYDIVESMDQVDIAQELQRAADSRLAYSVRVLVSYDEAAAEETERILIEELGYFPVSTVQEGSQFAVLVGNFSDETEATRLLPELLDEGFDQASVVNTERDILIGSTLDMAAAGSGQEILSSLSQGEQEEVQQFLERMRRAARGSSTLEEMQELQSLIFELQSGYSGLREAVDAIREQEREREERDRLVARVTDAIDQENWNTAEREIQLLRSQYPDDPFTSTLEARIAAARGADQPIERPTGSRTEEAVSNYIATAQRQVDDGNIDLAIITIETALRELPSNSRLQEYLSSLRSVRNAQRPQLPDQTTATQMPSGGLGGDNMLLYIIGAVVALLIVGFLVMWRRQSRALAQLQGRSAPAAESRVATHEAMPDEMAPAGFETMPDPLAVSGQSGGIRMDPSLAEQDVAGLSAMVMATLDSQVDTAADDETQPDMPAVGSRKISLDIESRPPAAAPSEEDDGRVSLDFGLDDEEETTEDSGEGGMVDLDFGLEEEAPPAPEPTPEPKRAPERPQPEPLPEVEDLSPEPIGLGDPFADLEESKTTVSLSIEEPGLDPLPGLSLESEMEPESADDDITLPIMSPSAGAGGAGEDNGDSIFTQRFSPAQSGNQPEEWVGAYDFASLTVVTDNTPNGAGAALRFEKSSGAGSAFYTCKFPQASGRVGIEFDLCCEEKNQYLLGLYFEHEENFRQSVHTVMHKTGETITLRLQGKTCDYEFGQWVHVKYLIDLPTGLVDGSVDGKQVARNVPMLSMTGQQLPPSINTISIRDTLASEGIFLLANIRVYSA